MWQATSDSIAQIACALTKALGELTDVPKGREAKIPTKTGNSYAYKYADLADALQMVRPILARHNLAVMQNASTSGDDVLITTTIIHESGEYVTFAPLALGQGRTAQEAGSAITYGRRYHLLACLGLAADDDDGATAAPRTENKPQQRAKAQRATQTNDRPVSAPQDRSEAETTIRNILATLPADRARAVRDKFRAEFGALKDLHVDRHSEALDWLNITIAFDNHEDDEWVKAARADDQE